MKASLVLMVLSAVATSVLIGLNVALFASTSEVQYLAATLGWAAIFVANVIEFKEKKGEYGRQ